MIALDTNVLIRLLLQDEPDQARAAERVLVKARRERTPLFIAEIVLCELVWVLTRRARQSRSQIADAITWLLDVDSVVVGDLGNVRRALAAYRVGHGDFADYLIREQAQGAGAVEVVTFDRAVKGEPGFKVLS